MASNHVSVGGLEQLKTFIPPEMFPGFTLWLMKRDLFRINIPMIIFHQKLIGFSAGLGVVINKERFEIVLWITF
jgi:hypothetical protein